MSFTSTMQWRGSRRGNPTGVVFASLASALLLPGADGFAATALCPCITQFDSTWVSEYIVDVGGTDMQLFPASFQNIDGASDVYYADDYGLGDCQAWDSGAEPYCDGATPPEWCAYAWCYVDPNNCIEGEATVSIRTDTNGYAPYYSYVTCGVDDMSYAKFERARGMTAAEIKDVIVEYLRDTRDYVENQMALLSSAESASTCSFIDGCSCSECSPGAGEWMTLLPGGGTEEGYSVTFDRMTVTHRQGTTQTNSRKEQDAECLSRYVEAEFKRIARLEYADTTRLGFLYYGEQSEGLYFGWPGSTLCEGYDPRFRSWYVSAVSGPKSVMLIIDSSGSMSQLGRWTLALQAVDAVMGTLSEYDFFFLCLFGSTVQKLNGGSVMIQATAANKQMAVEWLDLQFPGGQTDFNLAFNTAFQVIDATHAQSSSVYDHCNGIVLFLTDGQDSSDMPVQNVAAANAQNYAVFTYTLGDSASDTKPRQIACDNDGVYTHVGDGGDIANAMSGYYEYFATNLAFSRSATVRWTEYEEVTTNRDVITGCLPVYDRTVSGGLADLHGVLCYDAGIILTANDFKLKSDYAATWAAMESQSTSCTPITPSAADLDALRARVGAYSSCTYQPPGAANAAAGSAAGTTVLFAMAFALASQCLGVAAWNS